MNKVYFRIIFAAKTHRFFPGNVFLHEGVCAFGYIVVVSN